MNTKRCPRCEKDLPLDTGFHWASKRALRRDCWCVQCRQEARRATVRKYRKTWRQANREKCAERYRSQKLRREFGITVADYEALYREQGGVCAICDAVPHGRRMPVDHDHETKLPRGLLCDCCNRMLGHAGDDADLLRHGADYLEAWRRRHAEESGVLVPFQKVAVNARESWLRFKYGLSLQDYDARLLAQEGACVLCKRLPKTGNRLSVDHDHATNRVRALLDNNCNWMLGQAKDNPDILRKGATYLAAWKKRHAEAPFKLIQFFALGAP